MFVGTGNRRGMGVFGPNYDREQSQTQPPPPAPAVQSPPEPVHLSPDISSIDFTSSEYGRFIPIVFGADKVSGNVFWFSGFQEHTYTDGDTKYFYKTVSFAIGLCEGPIAAVLRIWVGDKLVVDNSANVDQDGVVQPSNSGAILSTTVDFISDDSPLKGLADSSRLTSIRVFDGSETQLPEGIMTQVEGWEDSPGYRGLAFVLFENFIVQESTIPNVYVEVLAQTTGLMPRIYYELPQPQEKFDRVYVSDLEYNPIHDEFIIYGFDNSGNGTPSGGTGLIFIDGNTFADSRQYEFQKTFNLSGFYGLSRGIYATSKGHIIHTQSSVNNGIVRVLNSLTGQVDFTLGPGGGHSSHSMTTGFGIPGASCVFVAPGPGGVLYDYFFCCGWLNNSYGIARIDHANQMQMVSVNNGYFPQNIARVVLFSTPRDLYEQRPTFVDGGYSAGIHVFAFSASGDLGGSSNSFNVHRITVYDGNTVTPENPYPTFVGTIDVNQFAGQGYAHNIATAAVDYTDYCIVLLIQCSVKQDYVAKWSPWTGEVLWATPVDLPANALPYNLAPILTSGTLSLIENSGRIVSIDLQTGAKTVVVNSLSSQNLPSLAAGGNIQFYNGIENSLTYIGSGTGLLTKVFFDRVSRTSVGISNIVENLLQRVGFSPAQINVEDLVPLSVAGYTVDSRKSLRSIFSELAQVFKFDVIESDGVVLYKTRGSSPTETIDAKWLGDVETEGWFKEIREVDFARYRKIDLTYRDIDREYGTNVQSVSLPHHVNSPLDMNAAIEVSVPIVLKSDDAKRLAEILLYSKSVYASQYEGILPPRFVHLEPADVVAFKLGDETITVRLREVAIGADQSIKFVASREDPDIYNDTVNLFGNAGRFPGSQLPAMPPLWDAYLLQMPFRTETEAMEETSRYLLYLTVLSRKPTQTRPGEALTLVINSGEETILVDPPASYPTWGFVKTPPDTRTSLFSTDNASRLRVNMINTTGATLASASSKLDLLNTPTMNLALVGNELIQFETVVNEGNGQYLLTGLHRALHGTDYAVAHTPGERFVLLGDNTGNLDETGIVKIPIRPGNFPSKMVQVFIVSTNPYQDAPLVNVEALNLKPWAVNHIKGVLDNNDIVLTWQRRSRYGGEWKDQSEDVPLSDGVSVTYQVMLVKDPNGFDPTTGAGAMRNVQVTANTYTYTAADQSADGFDRNNDTLYVYVQQTSSLTGRDPGYGKLVRIHLR